MAEGKYVIMACISKIEGKTLYIKGTGKYSFEHSNKKQWNVLESVPNQETQTVCTVPSDTGLEFAGTIEEALLVAAMLQKKSLKLTVLKSDNKYSLAAIEVP